MHSVLGKVEADLWWVVPNFIDWLAVGSRLLLTTS